MSEKGELFLEFLRSLDNDELIQYVNTISQTQSDGDNNVEKEEEIKEFSTPKDARFTGIENLLFKSFTSASSDPFDDGLDGMLAELDLERRRPSLQEGNDGLSARLNDFENEDLLSEHEDYEIGEVHKFGDYGNYFRNKHLKQQQADEEYIRWDAKRRKISGEKSVLNPIFEGCVIHVNGFTNPSISEIHRLVILHGGKFLSYLVNKGSATHIICDRLTPKKGLEFKNCKVVKAKWIVDCISKGELLNWRDYRLLSEIEYGQQRLEFLGKVNDDKSAEENNGNVGEEDDPDILSDENEDLLTPLTQSEEQEEIEELLSHNKEKIDRLNDQGRRSKFDAKHPDFLKHFFAKSRLHHLSAWKSDLRMKFLQKVIKNTEPNGNATSNKNDRIILHIDFDCFFATASCLNYPNIDINKDPIAVSHGGRTSDVASCNYVARLSGVRNGMWMGRAKKLCPNLITLDYDFNSYEKYSNQFYDYLISRNIFDSIFPVLIDEVLVDSTTYINSGDKGIINCVHSLAEEIRSDIFRLTNCTVSIGASSNVLLAKLALRKAKPDGYHYLHSDIYSFLDNIALRELPGIGHHLEERIVTLLGKDNPTLRDIRSISKNKLENDFGKKTGLKLFNYARGIDDTNIQIDLANSESLLGRKSVSVDVNYGIRFDTIEQVDAFIMNLSKELSSRLFDLGVCGSNVTLRLAKRAPNAPRDPPKYMGMGLCDFVSKSTNLGIPTNDWGILGSELKAILRMLNVPVIDLRGISVTMNKLEQSDKVGNKQLRLPFTSINSPLSEILSTKPLNSDLKKNKDHIPLDSMEIDWSVFEALPSDIKDEIKLELTNRGIIEKKTPPVTNVTNVPPGSKIYLQQLLPSQSSNNVKYSRVVESPKKSKLKRPKLSKSPLPVKIKKEQNYYDYTSSFDSSVVDELPSSIRNEVLKEAEYKKKIKNLSLEPLREKIIKKHNLLVKAQLIRVNPSWIAEQRKYFPSPTFLGKAISYIDMKNHIDGWVTMSLKQGGPHSDDIVLFVDYLESLLSQMNLNKCLTLIKYLRSNINYHESLADLIIDSKDSAVFVEGIADWNNQLTKKIVPLLQRYCNDRNLEFHI